jgi:alpha-tubulin suppressor-like RCC1 family protein
MSNRRPTSEWLRDRSEFARHVSAWSLILGAIATTVDGAGCAFQSKTPSTDSNLPCAQEMDCPTSNDPCVVSTCFEQRCLMVNAANNTVVEQQQPHDCRMRVCDGNGQVMEINDDVDLPDDDGNPCTKSACKEGAAAHLPHPVGLTCETNGVCNGHGVCGECLPAAKQCDGRAVATCSEEGQWTKDVCPAGKPLCKNASCLGIRHVVAGGANTCVTFEDGTVRCFGAEGSRRGARGTSPIPGIFGAAEVALGAAHTCARLDDGTVTCWGANAYGQVGDGTIEGPRAPTAVLGLTNAEAISAGDDHTCAIVSGGKVMCWGRGDTNALGGPAPKNPLGAKPKTVEEPSVSLAEPGGPPSLIAGLTGVNAVTLGVRHGCILWRGGRVACFGEDENNQLGTFVSGAPAKPKPGPKPTPRLVTVKGIEGATVLALGARHGCVVVDGGSVRCWGDNSKGQLGDGTTTARTESVVVADVANVKALALGAEHSCALLDSGTVRCWGDNALHQLGDGTTTAHPTAVDVAGLTGVQTISSAHGAHTCAMLSDGEVRCWGANRLGELGDGTLDNRGTPVTVVW